MQKPKLFKSIYNVAVVGLYRSGKSAFITSLINQIKSDNGNFRIGDGSVQIHFDEELKVGNDVERFPYEKFRCDNNGRWPKKTKAAYEYRCSFFRSDWNWRHGELSLLDIPGERLADLPMAKMNFADWSDWLLDQVFQDNHYRGLAEGYLGVVSNENSSQEEALVAYREMLARFYKAYRPIITPSTFLLKENGEFTGTELVKGEISNSFVGLSESLQFSPLPAKVRQENSELSKAFISRFNQYKKKVAKPLANRLRQCNELVVLVDVTTLLAANTGMYNGNREVLEKVFQVLSPGKDIWGVGFDLMRKGLAGYWRQRGISKVAVVATKADKVHDSQREKLTLLTKTMLGGIVKRRVLKSTDLDCRYFNCAAIKSTNSLSSGELEGRLLGDTDASRYSASELPESWPAKWSEGEFVYPDVAPVFPENADLPPAHLGLDSLVDFLLEART